MQTVAVPSPSRCSHIHPFTTVSSYTFKYCAFFLTSDRDRACNMSHDDSNLTVPGKQVKNFLATLKGYADSCSDLKNAVDDKYEAGTDIVLHCKKSCQKDAEKVFTGVK